MATPGDIKRFNDVICDIEDIKIRCPQCSAALKKVSITLEGFHSHAVLPYQYCQACDIYFIMWKEEDEHE